MLLERCDQLRSDLAELEFPLPMTPTYGDANIKNIMFRDGTTVLIGFEAFSWVTRNGIWLSLAPSAQPRNGGQTNSTGNLPKPTGATY